MSWSAGPQAAEPNLLFASNQAGSPAIVKKLVVDLRHSGSHGLRHTWKTNARRSGMDPEIREAIMGHVGRARSVRERYGQISDQELLKATNLLTFDHGETEIWLSSPK